MSISKRKNQIARGYPMRVLSNVGGLCRLPCPSRAAGIADCLQSSWAASKRRLARRAEMRSHGAPAPVWMGIERITDFRDSAMTMWRFAKNIHNLPLFDEARGKARRGARLYSEMRNEMISPGGPWRDRMSERQLWAPRRHHAISSSGPRASIACATVFSGASSVMT
jgi:hypothetical protein